MLNPLNCYVTECHFLSPAVSRTATSVATEPKGPHVKTEIPGPKSKALLKELSKIQVGIFW